ncbi:MAG TPA: hypothetical protein ENK83_06430 [Aliiroseovarius sp.]|nr:hypothetical protein [Aliiroseovarius sp.]
MSPTVFCEIPLAPWRLVNPSALEATRHVPTMLAEAEQRLYHWLTAEWFTGAGDIVELGCLAGGSTARLAEGLRVGGAHGHIHAYDRFIVNESGKAQHLYPAGVPAFEGDDLLPVAQQLLEPWEAHVSLYPGPIEARRWHGKSIELLVMDASKSTDTADRFAEIFYPSLIPGRSFVVQQDYLHWKQPWVAAQMELMTSAFTPVAHAPQHTVVFRCDAPVDASLLERGRVSGLDEAQLTALLRSARKRLRALGLGKKVEPIIHASRANPGVGRAGKMARRKL